MITDDAFEQSKMSRIKTLSTSVFRNENPCRSGSKIGIGPEALTTDDLGIYCHLLVHPFAAITMSSAIKKGHKDGKCVDQGGAK